MASRYLSLRRADRCRECGRELPAGEEAWWDAEARNVTCSRCRLPQALSPVPERGVGEPPVSSDPVPARPAGAGVSAQREHDARRARREARVHAAHPVIGRLLLAVKGQPQHERAWAQGAEGERQVAAYLEKHLRPPAIRLDDRRMPRGPGNIDHVVIAPTGVFVIDTKALSGRIEIRQQWFKAPKLVIGGRDQTSIADGLTTQVTAVRAALARAGHGDVPVSGAFCFTRAELPIIGSRRFADLALTLRPGLTKMLNRRGPLGPEQLDALASVLRPAFPSC